MSTGLPEDWGMGPPNRVRVAHGDSREVLKQIPDASVDSVVTDPPYALVSIVKRFGSKNAAPAKDGDVYARASAGFMGKQWDTGDTAFAVEFWREVFRVLKPGGHVVAFGGTRTYHRLAVAIEDAGFEIRDQIGWLYGSGFPKSHDVSKGIDKAAGAVRDKVAKPNPPAYQRGVGNHRPWMDDPDHKVDGDEPATTAAAAWQGWGTALKPAWEPIVLARKPLIGTVAENVLQHGTAALNIDGCRVSFENDAPNPATNPLYRKEHGYANGNASDHNSTSFRLKDGSGERPAHIAGRWPANVIHDGSEEVIAAFPDAPGQQRASRDDQRTQGDVYGAISRNGTKVHEPRNDSGSAARFFYSAKADHLDRLGSKHPTVKPVDLMRYLCRLVTPPGGLVLDPFAGSGSTGVACIAEGFRAILIEREEEYVADIRRRIAWAQGEGGLTDGEKLARVPDEKKRGDDLPLFGGEAA